MFMKKLLTLVLIVSVSHICYSQSPKSYTGRWKQIDSLVFKRGLPKSALKSIDAIYTEAVREKNNAQIIKALIYKTHINDAIEDSSIKVSLAQLEKDYNRLPDPSRSIIASIIASTYWNYYNSHRWQLYNRTSTPGYRKADLETWTSADLLNTVNFWFTKSLASEQLLKTTRLDPFDAVINKGNTRKLRPTLFDLLAHRALEYYKNDEPDPTNPAIQFRITDPAAFAQSSVFASHAFVTTDTSSRQLRAIKLFQKLIAFHLQSGNRDALVDIDLDRIQFVHTYASIPNKDELYRRSLENIVARFPELPGADQASYLLAQQLVSSAESYDPLGDTAGRYGMVQARRILEKVLSSNNKSEGAANASNLMNRIMRKELVFEAERVNLPMQPFRVLLSYRNVTKIHLRVIRLSKKQKEELGRNVWENEYWQRLLGIQPLRETNTTIPETNDHQQHRVELKIDALPAGEYVIIGSADANFDLKSRPLTVHHIHVSSIAYFNKERDYFVVDRQTGVPLPKAQVNLWQRVYDSNRRRDVSQLVQTIQADANGFFRTNPPMRHSREHQLQIIFAKDTLFLDDYVYSYFREDAPEPNVFSSIIFTDRSIYRPGQLLYFKGIMSEQVKGSRRYVAAPGKATTLYLRDANGQTVDSIAVTTNEYGSYAGSFTIPQNRLTGTFTIFDRLTNNQAEFAVENYKRPRFSVEIPVPSGTYRLGDSVQATISAVAYAGNALSGATVKYRVVRRSIMPLWDDMPYLRIWPPHRSVPTEIAFGTASLNKEGKFSFRFKAHPDEKMDKKFNPIFHYEVVADVTDINGESRSGQMTMAIGYQRLQLNAQIPAQVLVDSINKFSVTALNMNDQPQRAIVSYSVKQLAAPTTLFRERRWRQPDQFVMSASEFKTSFPSDVYSDELDMRKWPATATVISDTFTTTTDGRFQMARRDWKPGWYKFEFQTRDSAGDIVRAERFVNIVTDTIVSPVPTLLVVANLTRNASGQTIPYRILTNLPSPKIFREVIVSDTSRQFIDRSIKNNLSGSIQIDQKGTAYNISAVAISGNRYYNQLQTVAVPFDEKELTIQFLTYRDRMLPGSQEKWKIRIGGKTGDKRAFELLTAMYDASLDQFRPHNWNVPSLWNVAHNGSDWRADQNFVLTQSEEKYFEERVKEYSKTYDQLLSFSGRILYERASMRTVGIATDAAAPTAARAQNGEAKEMKQEEISIQGDRIRKGQEPQPIVARKNFNETAFFFPQLQTDSTGAVEFTFTMPEALTQWKWMLLASSSDLAFGYAEKTIVTQKEFMVQPNAPRFITAGDRIDLVTKIVNTSKTEITGQVELQLFDPITNTTVDGWFKNMFPNQYFTVEPGGTIPVSFTVEAPFEYNRLLGWRIIAKSKTDSISKISYSDGEESVLPVMSNRIFVTETRPLPMTGNGSKSFNFASLSNSGQFQNLTHHSLTFEFTSNPAWYAVQALPYLSNPKAENSEQFFNAYYANAVAAHIARSAPGVMKIINEWKQKDTSAFLSNLEKNPELKSVLLAETPWVLESNNETMQRKNVALLFDVERMASEQKFSLDKLISMQTPNGGFMWFQGGRDDRYMTQMILTGIGRLIRMNALTGQDLQRLRPVISAALKYSDERLKEDHRAELKAKSTPSYLPSLPIQYLYMRSYFASEGVPGDVMNAYTYYRKKMANSWISQSRQIQGMIAVALHRTGEKQVASNIIRSLHENSLVHEELGMYWKENVAGWYWYQSPVETQSLLIEAFAEINGMDTSVAKMKTWLLKHKQTNHWPTSRATADACYALLINSPDLLSSTPTVSITAGGATIKPTNTQGGTGYFKTSIAGNAVKPDMGAINVTVSGAPAHAPTWGAAYWQYFAPVSELKAAGGAMKVDKTLFIEKNSARGRQLIAYSGTEDLNIGDRVVVRIVISVDRNMEYIHLKDSRASGFEPVNVLSGYKWQGALGYYESTGDASTNFYFDRLPKGTYVFEYPLFVAQSGRFTGGIATLQSFYAPEFAAHSEATSVSVEKE
jgi:hypothetical protein